MVAVPGPRRHLQMGDAGGPSESSGGHGSAKDLPVMPGPEKPLLHIAIEFVEMLDNALAEHQMLNVAHTANCQQMQVHLRRADRVDRVARSE